MSRLQKHLLIAGLLTIFTLTFSIADVLPEISCYQCHSHVDEDCHNLSVNRSIYYKPCNESWKYAGLPFCRKIVQTIHGWEEKEVTVRRCSWVRAEEDCYRVRNWGHSETVCQCFTDGCNLGSTLQGTMYLIVLPLLLVQVRK